MEQEKIGITEVAQHAGVSVATVSRVLNRKAGVSQKTRQLVERAMEEVGYERGAASGGIVGVITPGLSIPIFGVMAERIGLALAPHGLRAVVCPALPGGVQERDFLKSLLDLGASGIVFCSASNTLENFDPEVLQLLEHRPVPYVCINGRFEDSPSPSPPTTPMRPSCRCATCTGSATAGSRWRPDRSATVRPTGGWPATGPR